MVYGQDIRVDDLGNRNIFFRINDISSKYLLLPIQESAPESGVYVVVGGFAEPCRTRMFEFLTVNLNFVREVCVI